MSERDYLLAAIERCEKRAKSISANVQAWFPTTFNPGQAGGRVGSNRLKQVVPKRRLARDLTAALLVPCLSSLVGVSRLQANRVPELSQLPPP